MHCGLVCGKSVKTQDGCADGLRAAVELMCDSRSGSFRIALSTPSSCIGLLRSAFFSESVWTLEVVHWMDQAAWLPLATFIPLLLLSAQLHFYAVGF